MLDTSCWLNIASILKRKEKGKRTVSEISSLFVWLSPIKILLYFKCTLVLKSFGRVISSVDLTSFEHICFSLVSLSLILARRFIASLKHYKGIFEIWLQLTFSNPEARSFAIWVGRKTKDLVVYVKVNWHPLTNVWDQSSPKLTSTLFAGLPYARNRSLDKDLFCGVSSATLPSTSYAHKMDSRPGIIIYTTSQYCFESLFIMDKYFNKKWSNLLITGRNDKMQSKLLFVNLNCLIQ